MLVLLLSIVLAVLLVVVGAAHLVVRRRVEPLVPEWWPRPRLTVLASGVVEIALGIGLVVDPTRQPAAVVAAVLFVAYTGVHLDDLRHTRTARRFMDRRAGVLIRAAVNLIYAGIAVCVAIVG